MTSLHHASALQVLGTPERQLRIDAALPLQTRRSGWLLVDAGQVWITRSGDAADHVLAAGQAIALGRGQQLVVEPWRSGQVARLRWALAAPAESAESADSAADVPAQPPALRPLLPATRPAGAGLAWPAWRLAAWALRGVAVRLAAAARNAESRASAAQGRICAGDSMAASGALQ